MDEVDTQDSSGIRKPLSAFHHYSKINNSIIREEVSKEGKETNLGVIAGVVSSKWKNLGEEERLIYNELAREDKERYDGECRIRDEKFLHEQEERRRQNAITSTDTKLRGTTISSTDAMISKTSVKRTRDLSEREKEQKELRLQSRTAEENSIKMQHKVLQDDRVQQAEARLKYLLSQSDIFAHFGAGKDGKESAAASSAVKSKSRRTSAEELDEDEAAVVRELEIEGEGGLVPNRFINLKTQPSIITGGAMRSYQLDGLNWMIRLQENGINGILADEMGLGKTLQSISVIAYMREFRNITGPHLIVVPLSTLPNWCREFANWCPSIRILKFHGSKEDRDHIISNELQPGKTQEQRRWDVVLTTYEVINLEKNALTKIAWRYLIIDEAHRLKNEQSQFSQTIRLINVQHRLLLTGTPLQNNLHELWSLLNFLLPDVFASSEQFDEWFDLDVEDNEAKQRMITQLHKLLRPFMLRRLKIDVETSLPPKTETILFTGMSEMQKNLYRQILLRDIDTVNGGGNGSQTAVLNIVMQLRKCCNHPYLFPGVEDRSLDTLGDHLFLNCGKMALLDKLLVKLKQRGHRVLIFSQMTRMLDIMEDYFLSKGFLYCRIDGNTSYEEREDRINDYNRPNSDKFIFLLSTRAGGLGINLQTADTVIIYDSDWNPQADLQAQDRAHRIGQKKVVQVFRLVTDDTVEVKVVERAQQKLKLDAMVVQQGRLQEKEKKLTKQDLLDTVRFGADKIFRTKESTITDDDIDLILEQGRQRTMAMNEKLKEAEKGDIYDFRLDGGMSTQVFEGKDYSDKTARDADLALSLAFIDPGKRERKPIATYAETNVRAATDDLDKKPKLPRHLKLPRMEDWQFYDKTRLLELQEEEIRLFDQMADRENIQSNKLVVLPKHLHDEKLQLLEEGFCDWTKVHYNNFIRYSAKHGRTGYEKIAKDIRKPLDETKRYAEAFWSRGPSVFQAEWDKNVKAIEKGERRLEEIQRLTSATAKLIGMFDDPWEELTFRNVGNQGRLYNAVEDRYLLCLTHLHGHGNWDLIRSSIRRCERFRFDFYLQSLSSEVIGKRCETLMKSAERELAEIERKRQAADAASQIPKVRSAVDVNRERLVELEKQIEAESRKLANVRAQLQRNKSAASGDSKSTTAGPSSKKPVVSSLFDTADKQVKEQGNTTSGASRVGGIQQRPVPDENLPELCRYLIAAGSDGVVKVIEKFVLNNPSVPKRQVGKKIAEIAIKEKRPEDTAQVWHIKPEFEHYLVSSEPQSKPAKNSKAMSTLGSPELKKRKSEETTSSDQKGSTKLAAIATLVTKSSAVKRKKSEDEVFAPAEVSSKSVSLPSNSNTLNSPVEVASVSLKEPKKYKRAFGLFVKERRPEAETKLSDSADTEVLKKLLAEMWTGLSEEERQVYEAKEREEKERYDREMLAWTAGQNSNGVSVKKRKGV